MFNFFKKKNYLSDLSSEIISKYQKPNYILFREKFGISVPEKVKSFFEFKEKLLNYPFEIPHNNSVTLLQGVYPLDEFWIAVSEKYKWNYLTFAYSSDGQPLLFSLQNNFDIYIDYNEDNEPDLEYIDFNINDILIVLKSVK